MLMYKKRAILPVIVHSWNKLKQVYYDPKPVNHADNPN